MESKAPFPVTGIPKEEALYLQSTREVQSDSREIADLSASLTARAATEYEAITAILNHVSDTVRYAYNPPQYDALYTLHSSSGNCQNFAHLTMALLRAAGIPARIVGGISLKEPWKIPLGHGSFLAQSMGQGGHAWIEIFFSWSIFKIARRSSSVTGSEGGTGGVGGTGWRGKSTPA